MATDILLLKDHGQREVQETLLRFGVPDFIARGLAQVELLQWRRSELLSTLQKLKRHDPDLRHFASQPQNSRSFFGVSANVETPLQWIKPPLSLIERAAREKQALCVNAAGEFRLDPGGYVAISHVWEEGIQADAKNRGISKSTIQQVFATLNSLNVSWIWLDGLAIPGSNQTLTVHEEELKKDIINNLVSIYRNAEYVVIFDALVMQLRSTDLVDTAVCLLCGKWMTRVWTYQEIFMARKALVITATGTVLFLDMVQALRLLSGNQEHQKELLGNINVKDFEGKIPKDIDSRKFENMYLRLVRLMPLQGKHPSLTAMALSCHERKTSNDVDYARAFFPVLGLTWKTQYSREEGMHKIYDSQRWYAKRLLLMHGSPRSSHRPGWAPSYLTGLQGPILSPDDPLGEIEWEKRGLRRKWYTYKVKAHHPARKEKQLLLEVDDPEKGAVLMGCLLSVGERKQSVEGFIDAIKEGFAFILSNSHISFPTSNGLCINAMLVERDHEVQDDDEAWVYLTTEVSAITQPLSQQIHSWCLLHESPIGTSDLSGKAHSRIARMINNQRQIQPRHGPLLAAIGAADSELIDQLLAAGEDIHQTDDRGWTPLHLAVSKEQVSVVEALIQRQAAVNAQDRRGRTPLNIAAEGGHAQLVEMLLAQGADPNIHPFDELSSLNQAIIKHHHHIMKLLLDNGAEATNKDLFGFAPLLTASGDTVSALLLLDHGVDPNLDLVGGSRLLHMAARGGNTGLVQYLLENSAEVDIREGYEDHGNTALYRAVEEQQEETVQILLEHQADPNLVVENSWTCVLLAASIGNYAILQLLLRHGPRRVSYFCLPEHWTALHIASKNGHRLTVKALLEAGWDYTTEDASGSTPAQLALEAGHQSTAQAIADFHLRQLNAGSRKALRRSRRSRVTTSLLFVNRDQTSESFSRTTSDEASAINSHAQRWRNDQRRQREPLPGLEKGPSPSTTPLLFINKGQDSTSLTRSNDAEAAIINSHPQRWRNQKIRQQQNVALQSKAAAAKKVATAGWRSKESENQAVPSSNRILASAEEDQDCANEQRSKTDLMAVESLPMHVRRREDCQIMQANFSESDCIDPFSVTAVPIGKEIQSVLQYYLALSIQATYKAETLPTDHLAGSLSLWHRHSPTVRAVVGGALFNKMHMYALLTATAGRMRCVRVHLETACYNDVFLSIETSTPPLFLLTWDAPPLQATRWVQMQTELSAFPAYRQMGGGFTRVLRHHIFRPAMEGILTELTIWIDVAQYTWICQTATKADAEWISRKSKAMLHRLLSISAISAKDPGVPPSRRKEECCRFVLIVLLSYISTQIAWRSGKMNMARLQQALGNMDRDWGSGLLNQMLLWVLACGVFAAQGTLDEEWFVLRALRVARLLGVNSYGALNDVMCQFFYCRQWQDASMRQLAERILQEERKKKLLSPDSD